MIVSFRAPARIFAALAVAACAAAFAPFASAQNVTTVAGGLLGDGFSSTAAALNFPAEIVFDSAGNLYVADSYNNRVRKITSGGQVSTYAGNGTSGFSGDGGQATGAQLNQPWGLALDGAGNLYIADTRNNRIRKVTPGGVISTIAGDGTTAVLNAPYFLAATSSGTIYASETYANRVRKIAGGVISIFAGTGTAGSGGDGGAANAAGLNFPEGLKVMADGSVLIVDTGNNSIRRVDGTNTITTWRNIVGPYTLAFNAVGLLHVATGSGIYRDDGAGGFEKIAGASPDAWGFSGEEIGAGDARFKDINGLAFTPDGRLYISDYYNNRIRTLGAGTVSTFMGPGKVGGQALGGRVAQPGGLAYDSAGNLYVSERNLHLVRKITPAGAISTYAGSGNMGNSEDAGDFGPALSANLFDPRGLAVTPSGDLLIAERYRNRVRRITAAGQVSTLNTGAIQTSAPDQIAVDATGNIYVSTTRSIVRIPVSGTPSLYVGTGASGPYGENVPGNQSTVNKPGQMGFDAAGNLYFADYGNHTVRKITPAGIVSTVAGIAASAGNDGDGGAATSAHLRNPHALVVEPDGSFVVGDGNGRVRRVSGGVIQALAGSTVGFNGDGPVASTQFDSYGALARAPDGALLLADYRNNRIRKLPLGDASLPGISISDASTFEGASGTKTLTFTVSLSSAAASTVNFTVATSNSSATAGSDYVALSPTAMSIAAGQTSKTFTVSINGDTGWEPDESFLVNLSAVSGANVVDATGGGKIVNDDLKPVLSVADVSVAEGNSGTKLMTFTVTSSYAPIVPVSFDISPTVDGTADGATDYQSALGYNLSIAAGTTSKTYSLTINGDTDWEPDETVEVYVTNVINGDMTDRTAVGTILNDDSAGMPLLSIANASIAEGSQPGGQVHMLFTVSLSYAIGQPVNFEWTSAWDGTADQNSDFVAEYGSLTIPAGATSATIDVVVNSDTQPEYNEDFGMSIYNATGALISQATARGTILDDDNGGSPPALSLSDVTITEGDFGTKNAVFTLSLSSPFNDSFSATVSTVDGSAVAGVDYGSVYYTYSFAPGETSKQISIPIYGDTDYEADESFSLKIVDHNWVQVADGIGAATITNDDSNGGGGGGGGGDGPTLSIGDVSVSEGNSLTKSATFTITLSEPQTGPVFFDAATADGTALAGSDYVSKTSTSLRIPSGATSKTFSVSVRGDTPAEPDESFVVNLSNAVGATIADGQGVGTITNDDGGGGGSTPSLSIGDVSISEGNSGAKTATFTVSLSGAAAGAVTYNIATADGSATAGSDYVGSSLSGQSIAAGQTSKTFSVTINGDTAVEADESFAVNVSSVVGATVADGAAVGTITNDDAAATPSLSIGDVSISEGNSGTKTATFTVSLSAASASIVSFDVASANGTATAGSDFVALSLVGQQIAAGQTSKAVSVTINGDTTVESDETFAVNVSNVSGATVADGSATGTITNDDSAGGPTLSINDVTISEGNSLTKSATFTITLSQAQSAPVFVTVATANGTATSGSDYVAKTTTGLRIPIGQTSKTFVVTINGDTTSEPDETFTVNLSNATGGPSIGDGQGVGTITNDDAAATPTLSIADASVSEGNAGTKTLTFTVSLSPTASGTVSYDIATSNGSATAGSDYVASTLAGQQITAGQGSKTFVVTINGDATVESDETFNVTLSNVSGATLGDGTAVGTISNDDSSGGGSGPTLTIADAAIIEGNALTKNLTFSVKLSAASTSAVTYNIATADGTATAGTDYTAKSQTAMSIAAGVTSKTFVVVIKGDRVVEPNETFTVTVSNVAGATVGDGQAVGTITNDDAAALSMARVDAKGLVDDIDDGNGELQLTSREYASLLLDTASQLCTRTNAASIVAIEGVEHKQVLAELAEAANTACAGKPRYTAVMADKESRGFLVDEAAATVVDLPTTDAAGIASLHVLGNGHERAISVLVPPGPSATKAERTAQLRAIGQSVQAQLKQDAEARLALVGNVTVPGLVDLTARDFAKALPTAKTLPGERLLVSPALLKAYGEAKVQVAVPRAATEEATQVLQLQPADKR